MPTYTLRNKETREEKDMILSLSQREEILDEGIWEQVHRSPTPIISHTGNIVNRSSQTWKDRLKQIKKNSGRNTTIKT